MLLPANDKLDIAKLSGVFSDTTNSYKFYWLLAILDCLQDNGQTRIPMRELSLRMINNVWYPLDYFKLSFGKQDSFKNLARRVSAHLQVDNRPSAPSLFRQLSQQLTPAKMEALQTDLDQLLRWVPYRFIRPFFAIETKGIEQERKLHDTLCTLAQQTTRAPYYFDGDAIQLHEVWVSYLQEHQAILRGFTRWHLVKFLQKHNPNVLGLSEKLDKPGVRSLTTANRFWKEYLAANPALTCIYSNQQITAANLSLDHFLPWSFVAHDLLWNIIPTPKAVNSAKNDWLPSLDLHFEAYARLQFEAFCFHMDQGREKSLEDYSNLFRQDLVAIRQQPFSWFQNQIRDQVLPLLQTAQNLGFASAYIFKPESQRFTALS